MASVDAGDGEIGGSTVIEVNESAAADEISPLLDDAAGNSRSNPNMSIFSVSYTRRRSLTKDNAIELSNAASDTEVDVLNRIVSWVWNGSRYSGLLCAASSSLIYYFMEILTVAFPVRTIPLFQTLFTRSTIILLLSFLWLRKIGLPLFVQTHVRNLLILRSLTGLISVLSFIYSVQNLPLSLASTLNFATPIMASIGAKIILQEKLALANIGGIACSFFGLLLNFLPIPISKGDINETGGISIPGYDQGIYFYFAILIGILSSILGGISYCFIRAGSKASDHPAYTVLSFGLLATPISAICTFTFQEFVLPSVFTLFVMVLQGVLAFFAEISLARGLQIEKVGKITNILYLKVLLSQVGSIAFLGASASFNKLIGCFLVLSSICSTLILGPEKETE